MLFNRIRPQCDQKQYKYKESIYRNNQNEVLNMKKMVFAMLSLVIISMFLVGCAKEKVSDAELEAQLSDLSAEELDSAIETVEAEDTDALAGQAYREKIPKKILAVPEDRFLKTAYKIKLEKISKIQTCNSECLAMYETGGVCGGDEGDMIGSAYCGGSEQCVCLPSLCKSDVDCKEKKSKFKCINNKCIYPPCNIACKEFYGYSGGACGGSKGVVVGSAFCGFTFEQCMCYN